MACWKHGEPRNDFARENETFWHNLLVTQSWDVFVSKASYQYFDLLHRMAFGNYKTFIKAITLDPAMLLFLNGAFNQKDAPDENYGRELQELFCVGKGPDSNYTEEDVRAAARVLTGWTLREEDFTSEGPVDEVFTLPFMILLISNFQLFMEIELLRVGRVQMALKNWMN